MGGLDGRWVIAEGSLSDRIDSLITIATPHRGTSLGNVAYALRDVIPTVANGIYHADQLIREIEGTFHEWFKRFSRRKIPLTGGIMDPYAEYIAERDTVLDFGPLRLQAKAELLKGEFREWLGKEDQMPEDAKAELNARLDEQMNALEQQRLDQQVPALAVAWREQRQWLSLLDQVAVAVRLGERDADLAVQATTALGAR